MRSIVPALAALALVTTPLAVSAAEPDPMAQTTVTAIADSERESLVETSHRIAFTIQACEAAKAKVQDQAAQDLMTMIHTENVTIQKELAELMRSKAVPTPNLGEEYREDLTAIKEAEATEVYETYKDHQLAVSSDLVDTLADAAKDAKDADLRAFAERWLPAVTHHVEVLKTYQPVR